MHLMPSLSTTGSMASLVPNACARGMPGGLGMLGPVMSASMMPTFSPLRAS